MRFVKGYPKYKYKNGFEVYVNEEYWGRCNPLFVEMYLVDTNGNVVDECSKGLIKDTLKAWGNKYGKRTLIKD